MACKVGTYEGTGAAITLQIGFIPDYMKIVNTEDGDVVHEWFNGMAADTSVDTSGTAVTNAADGVTASAGVIATTGAGVILGTDLSESGKDFYYVALKSDY